MKSEIVSLLNGGLFPIVWAVWMMYYMGKHPDKLRMSYAQFRGMCLLIILFGVAFSVYSLLHLT